MPHCIQVSRHLGMNSLENVKKIEKGLWKCLFLVGLGTSAPLAAIIDFLRSDEIKHILKNLLEGDKQWFLLEPKCMFSSFFYWFNFSHQSEIISNPDCYYIHRSCTAALKWHESTTSTSKQYECTTLKQYDIHRSCTAALKQYDSTSKWYESTTSEQCCSTTFSAGKSAAVCHRLRPTQISQIAGSAV